MQRLTTLSALAVLLLGLAAAPLPAEFVVWEDFDGLAWEAQPWPLTENSQIGHDSSRSVSGTQSLKTSIECKGWGGGLKVANAPLMPPPEQGMSVMVFIEPVAGATGLPLAKLEVYPAGGSGETMGGPDTPLTAGEWTKVELPASAVTGPSEGCGIIFIQGEASGAFDVWIDALMRDGAVWEDFETTAGPAWVAANVAGEHSLKTITAGAEASGLPALEAGRATALAWKNDSDGVELKTFLDKPLDAAAWKRLRLRCALGQGSGQATPGLWLYDGEQGAYLAGPAIQSDGAWQELVFDLGPAAGQVNLGALEEIAIVLRDYPQPAGTLAVDHIAVER